MFRSIRSKNFRENTVLTNSARLPAYISLFLFGEQTFCKHVVTALSMLKDIGKSTKNQRSEQFES